MSFGEVCIVAAVLLAFSLVSRRTSKLPVTMPMVLVAAGAVSEATGAVTLDTEIGAVVLIAEVTLAVILFGDAVRINVSALRNDAGLPGRLLLVGLPISVALGTVMTAALLTDLSWAEAALVAAILSPTDAALGTAVVSDEAVPLRVRQGLNVESGLNDGMVLPAVLLFIALSTDEETTAGFWGRFVLRQVGLGVVVGLAIGAGGAWLLTKALDRNWVEGIYAQLGTLCVAVLAFAGALAAESNGFIAAFIAGLAFGHIADDETAEHLDEYTEDTGQLLAAVAFFLFGNLFVSDALDSTTVWVVLCALGTLTIGRIIPVWIALTGMGAAWPTRLFIGWFGPRGLASIAFGLLLLEEESLEGAEELFAVIALVVLASVVLHGASASWGARRYGRWFATMTDDELDEMPEAMPVIPRRNRWAPKI